MAVKLSVVKPELQQAGGHKPARINVTCCALTGRPPLHEGGYNILLLTTCYEQWGDALVSAVLES